MCGIIDRLMVFGTVSGRGLRLVFSIGFTRYALIITTDPSGEKSSAPRATNEYSRFVFFFITMNLLLIFCIDANDR